MGIGSERDGAVLVLRFERLERKNALTAQMYADLADALEQAATDPQTRVVVMAGDESTFTAGNDLGDFLANPPHDPDAPVFRFLRQLASFPKPLIAAVCGPAVGVGTTLLLHCDLVYAGDNAQFILPFVNLGVCPEAASTLLLPALAGYLRASEKLLLGEPFDAAEAREMGLVNRVMAPAEVEPFARAQAAKLAAKPLASVLETKRLMKRPVQALIAETMAEEGAVFSRMLTEPAAREAFMAFMQKRKPDFSQL
jgi:enoyl-CoA hydratase/carnithine racemase